MAEFLVPLFNVPDNLKKMRINRRLADLCVQNNIQGINYEAINDSHGDIEVGRICLKKGDCSKNFIDEYQKGLYPHIHIYLKEHICQMSK